MANDDPKLVVALEARLNAFERQMARAGKIANDNFSSIERGAARMAGSFERNVTGSMVRSLGQQRQAAQQLGFQLNDVFTSLAGGASPLRVVSQQAGQLMQALQLAGGARGAITALGGAFSSMLNPIGLVSIALIGITGYAAQFAAEWLSGSEKAELSMDEQIKLLTEIKNRWGDTEPAIAAYVDQVLEAAEATKKVADAQALLDSAFGKARTEVEDVSNSVLELQGNLELAGSVETAQRLGEAYRAVKAEIDANRSGTAELAEFQRVLAEATSTGISGIDQLADKIRSGLTPAIAEAASNAATLHQALGNMKLPDLGTLTPLVSGGGKFLNPAEFQEYRASNTLSQFQQGLSGKDFLKTKAVSGRIAERIDGLDEAFAGKLAELLKRYPELDVISATRTTAEQAAIYNSGVRPAAKPGHSRHERGLAVDLGVGGAQKLPQNYREITAFARTLGLESLERIGDPMHFQMAGQGGAAPVQSIKQAADAWEGLRQVTVDTTTATMAATEQYNAFGNIATTAIGGLANALQDGKIEASEMLQIVSQLIQQLLSMPQISGPGGFLSSLFGGGAGGGLNYFPPAPLGGGGLLGAGLFHSGGVVGAGGPSRRVPASLFAGAPRYHDGGVAGLRPGEVPSILKRGEIVLPNMPGRQSAGGQPVSIRVSVDGASGDEHIVKLVRQGVAAGIKGYDTQMSGSFAKRMAKAQRDVF